MSQPPYWYAYVNGQVQGPFTAEQVTAMARSGIVTPQTPLCGDGRTYLPASQALPQLFDAARGPAAPPPMAPPMVPRMAPPMGPPMMPLPSARRGGKGALFACLGVGTVAIAALAFVLFSGGGGGGSLASLAAELPAGDRLEFTDFDAMEALAGGVPHLLEDVGLTDIQGNLLDMFPKGKRGVSALVRTGDARVRIYCPRRPNDQMLITLLMSLDFEKKNRDGLEVWTSDDRPGCAVAIKGGRICAGDERLVGDVLLGKLPRDKTFARSEGGRELLARLSSSAATVEIRRESDGLSARSDRPEPSWSAQEMTVTGSRVKARNLGLFERAADAERTIEKLNQERPKLEDGMRRGRDLPVRDAEFESLGWERRGTLVIITGTFKRPSGKGPGPGR